MHREKLTARPDWEQRVISNGLSFATTPQPDGSITPYWIDDAAYVFTLEQIEKLESVTSHLWVMALEVVKDILTAGDISDFGLPPSALPLLRWSWDEQAPSIYGRFDVAWDGHGSPKLIEFNADTPTGLIESAVCQWFWLEDQKPGKDQYNSLHERLVDRWRRLTPRLPIGGVHFAFLDDGEEGEDWVTTQYMRDTATQAGLASYELHMTDIGYDSISGKFVDQHDKPITAIFKLYPWEDMLREGFAEHLYETRERTRWFEPAWKALLSNKAFLAHVWRLFPRHEYLLPAYLGGPREMKAYAKKPLWGREGDGVTLHRPDQPDLVNPSKHGYGSEGYVYQQLVNLPEFDGYHPILGLWLVDQAPAGMGIRESTSPITDYFARFVPHYIDDAAPPSAAQAHEWIAEDYR